MRFMQTDKGFFTVERVDGEDRYTKRTQIEWLELKEDMENKARLWKGAATGVGITVGAAGGELALGGVAAAAEAVVAAPAVLTVAAVVGAGALIWAGCSALSDWAND